MRGVEPANPNTDTERVVRKLHRFMSHRLYHYLRNLPLLLQNVSLADRNRYCSRRCNWRAVLTTG
jgi:hypothetical protein